MRRVLVAVARAVAWLVLTAVTAAALAALVGVLVARSGWGRRRIAQEITAHLDGSARFDGPHGNLTREMVFRDLEVRDADGRMALAAARLRVRYDLLSLLSHRVQIDRADVVQCRVWIRERSDGKNSIGSLFPAAPSTRPWPVMLAHAEASGTLSAELGAGRPPLIARIDDLAGALSFDGAETEIVVDRVRGALREPLSVRASGRGRLRFGRGVALSSAHATLDTDGGAVAGALPELRLRGPLHATIDADGPLDALLAHALVEPARGHLALDGRLTRRPGSGDASRRDWSLDLRGRGLDAAIWRGAPRLPFSVDGRLHGASTGESVVIDRFAVTAVGARVRGEGVARSDGDLDFAARFSVADLGRLRRLGVPVHGGGLDGRVRVLRRRGHLTGVAHVEGARLRFAGIRAARLALDAHLDFGRGAARDGSGYASLEVHDATVGEGRSIDHALVDLVGDRHRIALGVTAHSGAVRIALEAHARLRDGAHALDGEIARLTVGGGDAPRAALLAPARFTLQPHGARVAGLRFAIGDGRLALDGSVERGAIDAQLALTHLDAGLLLHALSPSRARRVILVDGAVHAAGTTHAPEITARLDAELPRPELHTLEIHVEGRWATGRLTLDADFGEHKIHPVRARAELPLPWSREKPLRFSFHGRPILLSRLSEWMPSLDGIGGLGEFEVAGHGSWAHLVGEGSFKTTWSYRGAGGRAHARLSFGDGRTELVVDGTGDGAKLAGHALVVAEPSALLESDAARRQAPFQAGLTVEKLDFGRLPRLGFAARWPSAGELDAHFAAAGALASPSVSGGISARRMRIGGLAPIGIEARIASAGASSDVAAEVDLFGGGAAKLVGHLDRGPRALVAGALRDGALHLAVDAPGFDLARLRPLRRSLGDLSGRVRFQAVVDGTPRHPVGAAEVFGLDGAGVRVAGLRFARLHGHGDVDGTQARFAVDAVEERGGTLRLDGGAPLATPGALAAHLVAHHLDVGFASLVSDEVRDVRGLLEADLTLDPSRGAPSLRGALHVTGGALICPYGRFHDVAVDAQIDPGGVRLTRLAASSGSGHLTGSGRALVDGVRPSRVDLAVAADGFSVNLGKSGTAVDGRFGLRLDAVAGGYDGTLTAEAATLHLPQLASDKQLADLAPLEDVELVDEKPRSDARTAPLALSLRLAFPGGFAVRGKELDAQVAGDLRLRTLDSETSLLGDLSVTGGWIDVLGRQFTIEHARLGFEDEEAINPALDVRLSRQLSAAAIQIDVAGTMESPTVALSSDPPIYDPSQIVGIIISGEPSSQPIGARALDQKAVGSVSGVIVSRLKDQLLPGLPLEVVRIDVGSSGYGLETTRLEIGKYLTDQIYLSYVHQFGIVSPLQRQNSNQATLQWRFARRLQLESMFGDSGIGALDLYLTLRR